MELTKLLLIDDEDDIREVAALTLETIGDFSVFEAAGGLAGVEAAEIMRPDVILLDVMMPGIDGPATLALLKERIATRDIPVIFMTARTRSADHRGLSELGADGIISKPFDPKTLARQVRDILTRATASRIARHEISTAA